MRQHPEAAQVVEEEERVCCWGRGTRMPAISAMTEFARVLSQPPRRQLIRRNMES